MAVSIRISSSSKPGTKRTLRMGTLNQVPDTEGIVRRELRQKCELGTQMRGCHAPWLPRTKRIGALEPLFPLLILMTRGDVLRYALAFALRRARKIMRGLKDALTEDEPYAVALHRPRDATGQARPSRERPCRCRRSWRVGARLRLFRGGAGPTVGCPSAHPRRGKAHRQAAGAAEVLETGCERGTLPWLKHPSCEKSRETNEHLSCVVRLEARRKRHRF